MATDGDLQDLLKHEQFMAELLKFRQGEKPKPWWERAGFVPAMTAVLTVLVTSIAGYYSQKQLKEREALLTYTRERGQLAREAAKRANTAIAGMLKANEERLKLAHGDFDLLPTDQLNEIARGTNKLQEGWRLQREDLEMDLFLLFAPGSGVFETWQAARQAVDSETQCVESAYLLAQKQHARADVCRSAADSTVKTVIALREHLRDGYDQLTLAK